MFKSQFIELFGDGVSFVKDRKSVLLSDIFEKPQSGEWGNDDPDGNGVPILRTTNFTDKGFIDYTDVVTRVVDLSKVQKKALQYGDILIEKSGGSVDKPVGRVVLFEGEDNKYLNNNFTARLHLNGCYNVDFVYAFYFMFVNYWAGGTKLFEGKTTGIHNLRLNDYLQNTYISLPEATEQTQIVKVIRQSDKSKCIVQTILTFAMYNTY